ncbi:unnamed protein product [Trichobilharzia regenti]|nr:unnamed protein product [Trichobilharzia regenti]
MAMPLLIVSRVLFLSHRKDTRTFNEDCQESELMISQNDYKYFQFTEIHRRATIHYKTSLAELDVIKFDPQLDNKRTLETTSFAKEYCDTNHTLMLTVNDSSESDKDDM